MEGDGLPFALFLPLLRIGRCDLVCYYLVMLSQGLGKQREREGRPGQPKAAHACRITMNRRCTVMRRSRRQ